MMIFMIRQGVPYSLFDTISEFTPFTEKDWAEFLDLSPKSLQRYRAGKRDFRPIHSEKIIELAEITNLGFETFGSYDKFRSWLYTPSFALGSVAPFELLKDSYGKDMVAAELARIAHGILA